MAGESSPAWHNGTLKWIREAGRLSAKMVQAELRCLPDDGGKGRKKSKPQPALWHVPLYLERFILRARDLEVPNWESRQASKWWALSHRAVLLKESLNNTGSWEVREAKRLNLTATPGFIWNTYIFWKCESIVIHPRILISDALGTHISICS